MSATFFTTLCLLNSADTLFVIGTFKQARFALSSMFELRI